MEAKEGWFHATLAEVAARYIKKAPYDVPDRVTTDGNGKKVYRCRWCFTVCTGRRTSFCSQACVDEFCIRRNSGWLRAATFKRDRGVCAGCGLDCHKLERILYTLQRGCKAMPYTDNPHFYGGRQVHQKLRQHWLERFHRIKSNMLAGFWDRDHPYGIKSTWQADHIDAVIDGGGGMDGGMNNIRTLCVPCHKDETAQLAGRRARDRQREAHVDQWDLFAGPEPEEWVLFSE